MVDLLWKRPKKQNQMKFARNIFKKAALSIQLRVGVLYNLHTESRYMAVHYVILHLDFFSTLRYVLFSFPSPLLILSKKIFSSKPCRRVPFYLFLLKKSQLRKLR